MMQRFDVSVSMPRFLFGGAYSVSSRDVCFDVIEGFSITDSFSESGISYFPRISMSRIAFSRFPARITFSSFHVFTCSSASGFRRRRHGFQFAAAIFSARCMWSGSRFAYFCRKRGHFTGPRAVVIASMCFVLMCLRILCIVFERRCHVGSVLHLHHFLSIPLRASYSPPKRLRYSGVVVCVFSYALFPMSNL